MDIACYVRVSTDDQSLERQLERTHEYAKGLGADPGDITTYRDKQTGTDTARSGYQVLLEDVQLKQSTLDETYNRRTGVERTNESVNDCGLGRTHAGGRVHARAQVFLALCLRLVVAITDYERGDNPGSTIITV